MSGCKHGTDGACTRCQADAELAQLRADLTAVTAQRDDAIASLATEAETTNIVAATLNAVTAQRDAWARLYGKAINEANGLTNYVEDRPELRSAERRIAAIETEARALAWGATTPQPAGVARSTK